MITKGRRILIPDVGQWYKGDEGPIFVAHVYKRKRRNRPDYLWWVGYVVLDSEKNFGEETAWRFDEEDFSRDYWSKYFGQPIPSPIKT